MAILARFEACALARASARLSSIDLVISVPVLGAGFFTGVLPAPSYLLLDLVHPLAGEVQ